MRTPPSVTPTTLIVNARVATGDPRRPWADAVALSGDQVLEVGTSAALRKRVRADVTIVDAAGASIRIIDGRVIPSPSAS